MKISLGGKIFEVSKEQLESNPEEIKLEFDGVLRTQEEEATFVENHKKDARKEGLEIAVKQYREEYGFEGRSIDKLIEAVKTKTLGEAKLEPNDKIKKLAATLEDKQLALDNALKTIEEKETNFKQYKDSSTVKNYLLSKIPDNTKLSKEDTLLILQNKLNFKVDENGKVLSLDTDGNIIKNKTTGDPEDSNLVLDNFFKDNSGYIDANRGGAGGGDETGGSGKISIDDFIKAQAEKNIKPNSPEFNESLKEAVKNNLVETE